MGAFHDLRFANLQTRPHAEPKGLPRKTLKGRKDRAESKVRKSVRQQCVERDGYCRAAPASAFVAFVLGDAVTLDLSFCDGPSEWMHMHTKRRSQTRGMAPEVRHTTADSLMGCKRHHDQYDGRQKPRLYITALTRKGANGPMKFRRAQ